MQSDNQIIRSHGIFSYLLLWKRQRLRCGHLPGNLDMLDMVHAVVRRAMVPAPAPMAGPGVVLREIRRGGARFFEFFFEKRS